MARHDNNNDFGWKDIIAILAILAGVVILGVGFGFALVEVVDYFDPSTTDNQFHWLHCSRNRNHDTWITMDCLSQWAKSSPQSKVNLFDLPGEHTASCSLLGNTELAQQALSRGNINIYNWIRYGFVKKCNAALNVMPHAVLSMALNRLDSKAETFERIVSTLMVNQTALCHFAMERAFGGANPDVSEWMSHRVCPKFVDAPIGIQNTTAKSLFSFFS